MPNPYEVLEINKSATDEEIKRAYRELAKKYHPDNFKDNPLADLATEKMKHINQAYDEIQKERSGTNYNNNTRGYYNSGSSDFSRLRELIINKRFSEAEIMLDSASQSARNAEWFYLKGVLLAERGWYFDAQKNFEAAHNLEPNNHEYRDAIYQMRNKSNNFYAKNNGYNQARRNAGCSPCDICAGLMCADCLCSMFNCC